MSTVQRWLAALGDAAIEALPAARRAGRLDRGVRPGRPPRRSGGRRSSTPPRSTWCRSTARRRSTRRGRCCGRSCVPPVPSRCWPTRASPSPQEPPWSPWRDTALCCRRGAPARRRRRPGRRPVRRVVRPLAADDVEHRRARRQRVRARIAGDGSRAVGGGGRARSSGRSPRSTSTGCTTTPRACSPSPPRPGSPCTGATDGGEPPAHAGDAGPPVVHVRAAVPRRARPAAAGQGVLGHRRPRRPPATCCARSTTSCSTGRLSAPSSTRSRRSARSLTSSAAGRSDRRAAAHPGGAPAAPLPADPPHDPRDRRAAVRVPQHRQLPGRLDLPQARRLVTQRRGGTGDGDRSARRVAELSQSD